MKKTILIFFALLAITRICIAQSDSVRFEITISNPSAIVGTTVAGLPIFSSSSINGILSSYYITEFKSAYPDARLQYLRNVYRVQCNNINLANALKSANPTLFPTWTRTSKKALSFTPNDWNMGIAGGSDYLDYINARAAWEITRGDPSVVIGITDNYLHTSHPDFYNAGGASKIEYVGYNPMPMPPYITDGSVSYHHGTAVASMIAGATNNGVGLPAIGFDCKLDFSSFDASDNEMLIMSKKGRRIINCSWYKPWLTSSTLNLRNHFSEQGFYNELYENGTLMCFAATNGWFHSGDPNDYAFPASYDHVFSTTSIGWKNPRGSGSASNIKGVHDLRSKDDSATCNHNSRVDICAPTYLGAFRWVPWDPSYLYYDFASGTSSSSPLVAGTAGLIQSALKKFKGSSLNFSPYQLEWILKKSALTDIFSYSENAPYLGKLGAGRLDASGAAALGATHDVNDSRTQTMYIKGIDINTICAPGYSSNGVLPKLKPIIVNGTAPFTYVWEEVPDGTNTAILDNENIAEPTITGLKSGTTSKILYYRLTVYDNSKLNYTDATATAQKVAMKTFKVQLKTSGYDLAMRDSYMDMMEEANMQRFNDPRDWDTWTSPDIWNRQSFDGGLEHQNPEYFVSDPNHLYTRVRNVGCASSPADSKLKLYWTKASTGENWDGDWKYANVCGIGSMQPGGREITTGVGLSIPVLQPGDATIIHQDWYPIKPELYCGTPSTFEVCFLARIEEAIGMTIPEKFTYSVGYAGVGENIRNNNNIVTRNTVLTNLKPDNIKTMKRQLVIANGNSTSTTYNFEFASERSVFRHFAGDFSSLGSVTLHLGSLYDAWVASGSHGNVASQNAQNRTVTFDGANTLRLDSIPFTANQRYTIDVEFALDSPVVVNEVSNHIFHARQFDVTNPDEVYGAVNYQVTVSPSTQNNYRKTLIDSTSTGVIESFKVSPNPTSGIVRISYTGDTDNNTELVVTDMVGKKIMSEKIIFSKGSGKEINLSQLSSGIYIINITNAHGKTEVYKVTKE